MGTRVLAALSALASVLGLGGCASLAPQRPYRADVPAPPQIAMQRVSSAMRRDPELDPVTVDMVQGVAIGPWAFVGARSEISLLPPGETNHWIVARFRVFVRSSDPAFTATSVFVDRETVECLPAGFRWDRANVWGTCKPVAEIDEAAQARIDRKGAALRMALGL